MLLNSLARISDSLHLAPVAVGLAQNEIDRVHHDNTRNSRSMFPGRTVDPRMEQIIAKYSRGRCVVCEQRHRSHSLRGLVCSLRGWQLTLSNARLELDGPTDNGR